MEDVSAHGNVVGEFLAAPVVDALVLGGGVGEDELFLAVVVCHIHCAFHCGNY